MGPLIDHRSPGSFADTLQCDPEAWSLRINACWRKGIEAIIGTGRLLLEAKDACDHGAFESMLKRDLAFQPRTAQRLMTIARDHRLTNPTHASLLPASWTTLYELSQLSDSEFERGVQENIIRPDMERKDVEIIRPPVHRERADHSDGQGSPVADNPVDPTASSLQQGLDTTNTHGTAAETSRGELRDVGNVANPEETSGESCPHVPPGPSETTMPGGGLSIAHSRVEPKNGLDFFPTPLWGTRALFEHVLAHLNRLGHCKFQSVLEPACGEGHMAEVLKEYFPMVIASDIKDYGCGYGVADFLDKDTFTNSDWIITNPPFNVSTEFVLKAIELAGTGVAMFVRLSWLESAGRYEHIFRDHPPSQVAIFSERVPLHKGRWEAGGSTMTAYVWLVWIKGMPPRPPFWIPPGCRKSLTRPDDAARFAVDVPEETAA